MSPAFFLDPYSRPGEKRGGAWMDECIPRSRRLLTDPGRPTIRLPVAHLVCNQTPPLVDGLPFTHELRARSTTLFHEFGHGLQHMLTRVEPRDGVGNKKRRVGCGGAAQSVHGELVLPARQAIRAISGHVDYGRASARMRSSEKVKAARTYRAEDRHAPAALLRPFTDHGAAPGEFDHSRWRRDGLRRATSSGCEDDHCLAATRPRIAFFAASVTSSPAATRPGYYSYKWAEVLSADAFAAFEEAGSRRRPGGAARQVVAIRETDPRARRQPCADGRFHATFRGREPTSGSPAPTQRAARRR